MSRLKKRKQKKILTIALVVLAPFIAYKLAYPNSGSDVVKEDLGREIIVHLPNGNTMHTYEGYIIHDEDKVLYQSKYYEKDITGSEIEYLPE
ncbi:hypothetical protein [Peribacillus asahii]|uniref:hypothetical protein n=1 Tax=Peribacillus asahii TaxID=228899 RepID=UPI0038240961